MKVRARRGYLAATPAAATAAARGGNSGAAATAKPAVSAEAEASARVIGAAIGPLAGYARELPLRVQAAAGWKPGDAASAAMWVVGELGSAATTGDAFNEGFAVTLTLSTPTDQTVGSGTATVARGARTFRALVTPTQPLTAGDYVLRVGARGGAGSIPLRETVRLAVTAAPDSSGAIFVRRTGSREVPTADLRFRRNEQVRVEIPTASSDQPAARLLDRNGQPLAVPVTAAVRDDADGSRWHTAQLALAPLAPGDYIIELTAGSNKSIAAFRVVHDARLKPSRYRLWAATIRRSRTSASTALSGWPSVPRIPSSSSTFTVRNRSSGLVNFSSRTRFAPRVCEREVALAEPVRRVGASAHSEVAHADLSLQRRLIDIARELNPDGRPVRDVGFVLRRRAEDDLGRRPGRHADRFLCRVVSVGGLASVRLPASASSHMQPARLPDRAADLSQRPVSIRASRPSSKSLPLASFSFGRMLMTHSAASAERRTKS